MRTSFFVLTVALLTGCGSDGGDVSVEEPTSVEAGVSVGGSKGTGGARTTTGGAQGTGGAKTGAGGSASKPDAGGSGGVVSGTGGGAGAPPHVVGACDGLGAVDQWEDITPSQVDLSDNGVVEVLADPVHAGTIYTSGDKRGVYRSTDCGASWTKINTGRNGGVLDTGTQWSMAIDRNEPNVLYAGNLYGTDLGLFKSTNSGVDWDPLFPPGSEVANTVDNTFVQEVSMDPTDPKHLAVSFHNNCKGAYAPMCMAESKDAGATWRLFKGPAGGWVENARPVVLDATTLLYATALDGLFYSGDSGATWEKVGGGGGHQVYRATDGYYYLGTAYGMSRSADGHTWTQIQGSPNSDGIIGDGKRMFTGWPTCCGNTQPFWTASESDGTRWTKLASPDLSRGRFPYFAYDPDHHVLYVATTKTGLLRMVTQ